jgi:hypothetical protein
MTTTKRRTMTVTGDARNTVGQFRGPDARGELLIIDEAAYDEQARRTRLWLRLPTDDEVRAAADRAPDDMATQPWELPSPLSGPLGYVDVTCDGCGATTREYGITEPSKAWALCGDCRAKPDARARIAAKQREIREAMKAEVAAMVEEARPEPGSTSGPVTMRILGLASGDMVTPFDGQWLVEYDPTRPGVDPTGQPMTAHIVTTPDRSQARVFPDGVTAWREWKRESGLPYPRNAPLTAFSTSITPVDVPDDIEQTPTVEVPWTGRG